MASLTFRAVAIGQRFTFNPSSDGFHHDRNVYVKTSPRGYVHADVPGSAFKVGTINTTVTLSEKQFPILKRGPAIEVAAPRRGKPGYRWAQGWIVERAHGIESTPMRLADARAYMAELRGQA